MPVSTRSQVSGDRDEVEITKKTAWNRSLGSSKITRNPHHGLKEKMRALTQLYGQSKNQMAGSRTPPSPNQPTHHPSVDLLDRSKGGKKKNEGVKDVTDSVLRENTLVSPSLLSTKKQPELFFPSVTNHEKENQEGCRRDSFSFNSCPKREKAAAAAAAAGTSVVRKLSLGNLASQSEGKLLKIRRTSGMTEPNLEKPEKDSRIMVFVRLRPMGEKEKELGSKSCVSIVEGRDVYLTEFISETDYLRLKRVRGKHFSFDASFPETTTQQEVYSATTAELVEGVLQGKNGTVFCYGATGAGKTFTMLGTMENPGVMVLAMKDLFSKIRQRSCDGNHVVHLSYLEVYNETVRDLLAPGRPLLLREDKQGIVAAGLTQYRAYSTDEVMALLQQGNLNRTTEPTRINETSSRSHAILQVVAEYREKDETGIVSRVGKLSLIDLAGSERAIATEQRSQRSIEGANINRSLLALSSCINALVEGKKHIPYRNSKLTQLLKDSLGGHCNTVMIANISPSCLQFGETQNTLHWADRAKEIKTKGSDINEELVEIPESEQGQAKLLLELQKENSDLRQKVAYLQKQQPSVLEAQSMAVTNSNLNCSPSSTKTAATTPQSTTHRRPMHSILSGNCFKTPESKKKGTSNNAFVQELQHALKTTEGEMEKMKRDHMLQLKKLKREHASHIKQKDDFICELLTKKSSKKSTGGVGVLRKVPEQQLSGAELERQHIKTTPSKRFQSPTPAATKKRSFWDSSVSKSPSVPALSDGRKMRNNHVIIRDAAPPSTPPSLLLQLGCDPCFWFVFMLGPHLLNLSTAWICSSLKSL